MEQGSYEGWNYQISQSESGVTVRRRVFQGTLWYGGMAHREYLSGFSSVAAARHALQSRIQELLQIREETLRRAHAKHDKSFPDSHLGSRA